MGTNPSEKVTDYKIHQIGIVIKDMDKTAKFLEKLGIGPVPTIETEVPNGKVKIGIYQQGDLQIELIQPLQGNTIHAKWLKQKGEGIHHVSYHCKDIEKELQNLEKIGVKILDRGEIFGVKWAYLDTQEKCGFILELGQWPET
ncbi:MAG: VOC family protein [Candidatus Jordarchaeum sp.]|uniref:VOC family protein n=1 Tax=Candidatus Jordarchaeum sp. TaxID=2823881 RepID=UPI0040492EF7